MKWPFLVICVPGIAVVAILIALTPYRLHPDFTSVGAIAVQVPGNAGGIASSDGVREFLLMTYFGACIHIPPPPANRIIDVSSPKPVKWLHSMDAAGVSGVLSVARVHHDMGDSSYALRADDVDLYTGPSQ
jgi:hypothetical protein